MEQWKTIKGFEIYMISNTGRIKSKERIVTNSICSYKTNEKELKPADNGKGYFKVGLFKNGKYHYRYIHRLVAEHFIENPLNKPYVNHIDCNPKNNNVENLEWCTHKENMEWMVKQKRNFWTKQWIENHNKAIDKFSIAVVGVNIKTGEKIHFKRINDTKKSGFQPSCVCCCCQGKRKQHKGFRWEYEKTV